MIPAGGDQKFYDNFKKNEESAFKQAATFQRSQARTNAQIKQEQANPTVPAGEKKTEQPRDKGGRKRKSSSAEILRYPYDIMDEATDFLMVEVIKYNSTWSRCKWRFLDKGSERTFHDRSKN